MAESDKNLRRSAKIRFVRKKKAFLEYTKEGKSARVIDVKFDELTDAWQKLELQHDSYMLRVKDSDIETEEKWIKDIRSTYDESLEKYDAMGRLGVSKSCERAVIDLEKTKLPKFTGNIREYARFKSDYQKYVEPNVPTSIVAYTLRTCLSQDAAHKVRNTDDIKEMWVILDEKYADAATLADIILDDIQKTRRFDDDETQRFVDFVDKVEDGYHDLCSLGLQREITTTSSVSVIEQKLSPQMSTRWARMVVSDPSVERDNKLPSLLTFLRTEKRTIDYRRAGLRNDGVERIHGTVQHIDASTVTPVHTRHIDSDTAMAESTTCLIHQNSTHQTCDCERYKSKSLQQRYELLKQKAACWSCLAVGHRLRDCEKKSFCGEGGCRRRHHRSLHVDIVQTNPHRINHVTVAGETYDARQIKERNNPRHEAQGRSERNESTVFADENQGEQSVDNRTQGHLPMYRSRTQRAFYTPMFLCVVMSVALMNGGSAVSAHSCGNYVDVRAVTPTCYNDIATQHDPRHHDDLMIGRLCRSSTDGIENLNEQLETFNVDSHKCSYSFCCCEASVSLVTNENMNHALTL